MKALLTSLLAFACYSSIAAADDRIEFPKHTYDLATLEEAKAKATESKKLVAFLVSSRRTKDSLHIRAANTFIQAVERKAIIVIIPSDSEVADVKAAVPENIAKRLLELRNNPRIVLADPTLKNLHIAIDPFTYLKANDTADLDKASDELKKAIRFAL